MSDSFELEGEGIPLTPKNSYIFQKGKYAGMNVTEVPDSYLKWIKDTMDEGSVWHEVASEEMERRYFTGDYIEDEGAKDFGRSELWPYR